MVLRTNTRDLTIFTTGVVILFLFTTGVVYICSMTHENLPSDAELLLLQALWEHPDATVQTVHEWVEAAGKQVGYTTTLKQLQRLLGKGLVSRRKEGKLHLYRAVPDREATEAALIERMTKTAFSGSAVRLALKALGTADPTRDEMAELERWIEDQKDRK